jgi:hypothetical protein
VSLVGTHAAFVSHALTLGRIQLALLLGAWLFEVAEFFHVRQHTGALACLGEPPKCLFEVFVFSNDYTIHTGRTPSFVLGMSMDKT